MNVGKYLNLMPHMSSWRVYALNTSETAGNEVGKLAPATYGGLSYMIVGNPRKDVYSIRTQSFGSVNIFAPEDNDSSITRVPQFDNDLNSTGSGNYLNLQPHMSSWKVYPVGASPVSGNEVGRLAPSTFGGLSYRILKETSSNLYTIETESFGKVNIYAPRDADSSISSSPQFSNGGSRGSSGTGAGEFLNLAPHMTSWKVYPIGVSLVSGNEVGRLAPSRYGGLSYEILGQPSSNVYTIVTESFGRVNIYAPRDNDSTISGSPQYLESSDGSSGATHGLYLNLMPHVSSWRVYPQGVSMVAGNEVGKLGPSLFGGLTYRILGTVGANSYTIQTERFGKVNIYAPRDSDSSITSSPIFGITGGNTAPGGGNVGGIALPSNPNGVKVFLDAGHGGYDSGASGNGLLEKNVNLTIVKELGKILSAAGANVEFRRSYDTYNELNEIVNMANNSGADLFVSVHCNANPNPAASGTESYTYNASQSEFALSAAIAKSISSKLGIQNRGAREDNFRVITYTNMPAILVETGFISNSRDASLLRSQPERFAQAIAEPIILKMGIKPQNPGTSEEINKKKRDLYRKKIEEFREAYPIFKENINPSEVLPALEENKTASPISFRYGPFKGSISIGASIRSLGSNSSKVIINNGKMEGLLGTEYKNQVGEVEKSFGFGLSTSKKEGFALQVNTGDMQTALGLTGNKEPKMSVALNMPDQKGDGFTVSMSIVIELIFDPDWGQIAETALMPLKNAINDPSFTKVAKAIGVTALTGVLIYLIVSSSATVLSISFVLIFIAVLVAGLEKAATQIT
ncbi:N-acetylmuramoyl-L-alanine amidase [Rossellomorea marisflavi]|uniref:N-acetylmuramoyl-L-alanine amidase n=1 Tax=Rossellomorea marisflavi TaxID=189381 RepID=UPI0034585741